MIPVLVAAGLAWAPGAQAIVAGTAASTGEYPYQARVLANAPSGTYSCGASILDATHVVTAAHCVYIDDTLVAPANVSVGYGSTDIRGLTGVGASEVTISSNYLSDDSYDVAVIRLSAPLTNFGTPSVASIPLGTPATLASGITAGDDAVATGWGNLTENGSSPRYLQEVPLPLEDDAACSTFPAYQVSYVAARTVCAGGQGALNRNNPDTCQGDSGGPLAFDSGGGLELVGITSYGLGCGRRLTPAAYTESSDPDIRAVIDGTAPASSTLRGSDFARPTGGGAPAVTTPLAQAPAPPSPVVAARDIVRPTARLSKLSCTKKRRCSFRIRASDNGGRVAKLATTVTRKVRKCRTRGRSRVCSTTTRKTTLKLKRITGGFSGSATLSRATYKLTAVVTDAGGNRSKSLTKTFRVR